MKIAQYCPFVKIAQYCPFVKIAQCCPGVKNLGGKQTLVGVRVEATADFSGAELVLISDMKIRLEYFPADYGQKWGHIIVPQETSPDRWRS